MRRRPILVALGAGLGIPLGGCNDRPGDGEDTGKPDGTDPDDTEGDSGTPDEGDDSGTPDGDTGDDDADDQSIDGRLHNAADEPHAFEIRILDDEGEVLVDDTVDVEAGATERIPGVGAPGRTRTYEVAVDGATETETLEFDAESTPGQVDGYVDVTYTEAGSIEIEFTPPAEDGDHHLYLMNLDDESRRIHLEVVRQSTGETLIEGTYDVPDRRGGEFRDLAAWGDTYEVTATLESGHSKTFTWAIESCSGSEAPKGSRNGSVRVDPGGTDLSFVADNCDEIIAGTEAPTGPAEQFEVDDTEQ